MPFYEFGPNDILRNRLKTHPDINFVIYDKNVYYNNKTNISGTWTENVGHVPSGHVNLYEINVDRPPDQFIYPFITKNGSLTAFKTVSTSSYNADFNYGDTITGSYPLSASISSDKFTSGQSRPYISALRNVLNNYVVWSRHFEYSGSLGDKSTQELRLISIPSIFYGSSIKKGSVALKFYVTGTLCGQLVDSEKNGELRQYLPADSNSGSVAGTVLYNEGFVLLTGSWTVNGSHTEQYEQTGPATNFNWIDFGTTGSSTADSNVPSSSFFMDMRGTEYVPTITMHAHAPVGELNYSNNPTFLTFGQTGSQTPLTSSIEFKEFTNVTIKNIVKSNFVSPTGSFRKITYISKVGIFDEDHNLLGIAKLAQPVRKREQDSFTFRITEDI